jgi:hypothetical protein
LPLISQSRLGYFLAFTNCASEEWLIRKKPQRKRIMGLGKFINYKFRLRNQHETIKYYENQSFEYVVFNEIQWKINCETAVKNLNFAALKYCRSDQTRRRKAGFIRTRAGFLQARFAS